MILQIRNIPHLWPAADGERVKVVVLDELLHGEVVAGGGGDLVLLAPEPRVESLEGEGAGHPVHVGLHLLLGDGVQGGGDVLGEPHVLEHDAEGLAHQEGVGVEVSEARGLVTYQRHLASHHMSRCVLSLLSSSHYDVTLVSWM